jgi:putative flippase GtrA
LLGTLERPFVPRRQAISYAPPICVVPGHTAIGLFRPLWTFRIKALFGCAMSETPKNGGLAERTILLLRKQVVILKAMSFALIGVVNSLVDFVVFFFMLKYVTEPLPGEWPDMIAANIIAWIVAVSGSYVMNSYVTFAAESGRKLRWKSFFAFAASGILGVITNTVTLLIASEFVPVVAAKILAIGASFLVNFSMSHFVVFRPRKKHEG